MTTSKMASKKNVESMYGLSPMQQGMLFHALYAPAGDVYVEQVACEIDGALDVAAFRHAWQQVVARHAPLRTSFHWTSQAQPLQVVHQQVALPWTEEDWRSMDAAAQRTRLDAFLEADRARGFELGKPPLLRFSMIRLADATYHFVWTHHHLLLDGWSIPLVLQEVVVFYQARQQGQTPALALARPYRDYIAWLQQQDMAQAETFWRRTLAGFTSPTALPGDRRPAPNAAAHPAGYSMGSIELPEAATAALQQFARQHQLTLSTLVQGAWALLLGRYSGTPDVVFGTTVSGRPSDLPGVETMVGLFINTLPVRVRVAPEQPARVWLQQLQAQLVELRQYEYTPLVQIQSWSDVPRSLPLFETIAVFENYPLDSAAGTGLSGVTFRQVPSTEQTNYPLTLIGMPGRTLRLQLLYASDRFGPELIGRLLGHLQTFLERAAADPEQPVGAVSLLTEPERRQLLVEWNRTRTAYPHDRCIHHLFTEQAARTPDAVALVFDGRTTNDQRPTTNDHYGDKETRRQGDKEIEDRGSTILHPPSPIPHPPSPNTRHLTYAELNVRANSLAHHLRTLGVGPEVRVGLYMERSIELVIGLLGVLKAGGAYVPLDPGYPHERLAFMLADSQVAALLVQPELSDAVPAATRATIPVICLAALNVRPGQPAPASRDTATAVGDSIAYVMYTSGSTGTPKGIVVPHRAVVRLVCNTNYIALDPTDHVALASNTAFDAATFEIWGALLHGAVLVVVPKERVLSPLDYAALIREQSLTALFMTTALFNQFAAIAPGAFASVRHLLFGGEAVDPHWVREILRHGAPARLLHVYGPTEGTTFSTWHAVRAVADHDQTIPIGRPLANTTTYVLDAQMQPVPVGASGELYIGGDGLARGYWNRPALTAERFIPNPFAEVLGDGCWVSGDESSNTRHPTPITRLYKTGDLVRYRADGSIEFLGRQDHQVKLRGFRIELGEIEATLSRHPAVREVAVLAREDIPGEQRLVAYVVPKIEDRGLKIEDSGSSAPDPLSSILYPLSSELRPFLQAALPDFMIPSAFVTLDALPLTPNGKLDRRALPAPDLNRSASAALYAPPRTPTQEVIAGIWQQVMGLAQVGIHDNFFDLGGHSLLATQIYARLRAVFGVALPLRSIFEAPTLAALAEQVEALQRAGPGHEDAGPLVPQPRLAELPLALAQQRLWFLDQWEPGSPLYNIAGATRMEGDLRVAALAWSIQAVVRRHEALRTVVVSSAGQPRQVILPALALALPLIDLTALSPDARAALTVQLAIAEARRPFDLARGPLVRATLLRAAQREHMLLVSLHHIIADGWSLDVLMREISALYAAAVADQPLVLPELPIQYADYALWQRDWLQGEVLERQIAYWKQRLHGAPDALALPTDRPRPAVQTYQGASLARLVPGPLAESLRKFSQRAGVTLFMTLLAAFQVLLAQASGRDDIVVGTPIAGRTRPELEGLIGFFANTLVLRSDLRGDPSFVEVLGRVREMCLGAYAHQDVPFERLVHELQPQRSASHLPLFQVWFVLHEAPLAPVTLPGVTLLPFAHESSIVRYDLRLDVYQQPDGLRAVFEYKIDLFEAATIARMARRFTTILELLVTQADLKLNTLARALADTDDQLRQTRQETIKVASLQRLKNVRREVIRGAQHEEQ